MIGYLEGTLLKKDDGRILLLVNSIGYEVMLPKIVSDALFGKRQGDHLALYIYCHQTEKQPKPTLIGFINELDKEFFEIFLTVEAIGPVKAAGALSVPIGEIAAAIENKDADFLRKLKGVGKRTADKIVASLQGKMARFGTIKTSQANIHAMSEGVQSQVLDVLVSQLGHKLPEAKVLISEALERKPEINTPEELFDEIYRGESGI